jgi:hypothetical protein
MIKSLISTETGPLSMRNFSGIIPNPRLRNRLESHPQQQDLPIASGSNHHIDHGKTAEDQQRYAGEA